MKREYVQVKGIHPNSRFENELNPDALQRAMEIAEAMRLERLYGVPFSVKVRFVPKEASANAER